VNINSELYVTPFVENLTDKKTGFLSSHQLYFRLEVIEHSFRGTIAVGVPVARQPLHRSRHAVFPHRALQ
jgi:hypothetical protein